MGAVEAEAVLAANRQYYEAFEAKDLDAMSDLWERSERTICTHPGWATLEGWGAVAASFFALFQNGQQIQFVLTRERVYLRGHRMGVLRREPARRPGRGNRGDHNIFSRPPGADNWRMVCHHGSVVQVSPHQVD